MLVKDLMRRTVVTVDRMTGIIDVTKMMNKERISSVIVLDSNAPVGIITKRDLLKKCLEICANPCDLVADEILTAPLISTTPDKTVTEALTLILERGISTLPVIEGKKLIGIITANDIIMGLQKEQIPGKKASVGELEVERQR
ncbi:MAG: cyclic nucleotide-binding/CBS domain-containing protein [Candidatus Odinarchaeota archaeon]